jgi:uncharacterized protein (TIGR00251 family)
VVKTNILSVKVIPNAKKNEIAQEGDRLKVRIKAPASKGKANKVLIKLLADFFNVKKGDVRIVRGLKSRDKIIEIHKK